MLAFKRVVQTKKQFALTVPLAFCVARGPSAPGRSQIVVRGTLRVVFVDKLVHPPGEQITGRSKRLVVCGDDTGSQLSRAHVPTQIIEIGFLQRRRRWTWQARFFLDHRLDEFVFVGSLDVESGPVPAVSTAGTRVNVAQEWPGAVEDRSEVCVAPDASRAVHLVSGEFRVAHGATQTACHELDHVRAFITDEEDEARKCRSTSPRRATTMQASAPPVQTRARMRNVNSIAFLRKGAAMATIDSRRAGDFDPIAPEVHRGLPARFAVGPGLVAGLVMFIILVILSLAQRQDFMWPMKLVATTFLGSRAMAGGIGIALVGLVAHFVFSVLLAIGFAKMAGRTTRRRVLLTGILYGIALWAVVQFLILPWASPNEALKMGTVWPFFLGFFSYGLMVASTLPTVYDVDARPRAYLDPLQREVRP